MQAHRLCAGRHAGIVAVLFLAGSAVPPARADVVDAYDAADAVRGWLARDDQPLGAPLGCEVAGVVAYAYPGEPPVYYIVNLAPSGFVVVAADDQVEPIIAFVPRGTFDPALSNPLGALVNSDLVSRVDAARWDGALEFSVDDNGDLLQYAPEKWAELLFEYGDPPDGGLASVSDVRVAPLLQSEWSQDIAYYQGPTCYNYYTPSNYVCGCVATAMAQFMRFWQHPAAPTTTGPFTIYVNGTPQSRSLRGGDGNGGNYDWGNMVLLPESLCPPPYGSGPGITVAERQAIGALCHDAGVSVNMNYAAGGSGTDTLKAADAFTSAFGYANAVKGRRADLGNIGTPLNDMVNPNLDAGYPVVLGITGSGGGHAIVCDGYGYHSSTLYHHLNMGWSGSYNAWYALPTIETFVTFTSVYKCVYNVYVTGSGEIISGRVVDGGGQPIAGALVTATRTGGGVYTDTTDANGVYALAKVPAGSSYTVSVTKNGHAFTNQNVSTGTSTPNSTTVGNRWAVNFTGATPGTPAVMLTPPDQSQLGGSAVDFAWDAGTNVTGYRLAIGTTPGAADIRNLDCGTNQSVRVTALPLGGGRVYVRLSSRINGVWEYNDYWYTTFDGSGVKAELTAPADPQLTSTVVEFAWTPGTGITYYALWVGSQPGGKEYFSRTIRSTLSQVVTTLPNDGSPVYVRLFSYVNTDWVWNDYAFTAFNGELVPAAITSPPDQSTLTGPAVTLEWDAGVGVTQYWLRVGSSAGAADYLDRDCGTSQTWQVKNLPVDGRRVYVRLLSLINGVWEHNDYWYTAFDVSGLKAALTAPVDPQLASSVVQFAWTAGTGVTDYALYIGSTVGGADYFSRILSGQSCLVTGLPTDGSPVYVRLSSRLAGVWAWNDYTFTAFNGSLTPAAITSPPDQSTLAGSSVTLEWDAGVGVTQYWLRVGSSVGAADYLDRNCGTYRTWQVVNLPLNGTRIYVRLLSFINGVWQHNDYWYTAHSAAGLQAVLTDPAGPMLPGATAEFRWTAGTGVTYYALWVGSRPGGKEYFSRTMRTSLAQVVTTLPTNGSTVYVRLFSQIGGIWYYDDYTYTAAGG